MQVVYESNPDGDRSRKFGKNVRIATEAGPGSHVAKALQLGGFVLAFAVAAGMWLYANHVLRAHQIAEAAAHNVPRGNLSDLYPRWLGARELLLHGRDPYGADITRQIQIAYYGRAIDPRLPNDPKDQQGFAYPVYVVFVLAPIVKLSFGVVQQGFFWLLVALTASSIPLWMQVLGWRAAAAQKTVWILLVLGCFPAVQGLKLQQLTLLAAGLIAASAALVVRRHLIWAGILLAVASIKPQLVVLVAAWFVIWVLGNWRERQKLLWSLGVSMFVLVTAGEFLLPGWIGQFRSAAADYYRYTGGGRSVLDVLLTPFFGRVASAIVVVTTLILLWRERKTDERSPAFHWSTSLVLATTLLVIPMFAPYNQLLLLPAVMLLARSIARLWAGSFSVRVLVALASVSVIWPWPAAAALIGALPFMSAATVQKAWALPLYTSNWIPITIAALLFAGQNLLRSESSA